jgi:DNA-binding transcriptional MocR family regulator
VVLCREAGIPIVEDNPYGMLRFEGDQLPALRTLDPDNVIYLGTVSKVFSPGVRVGWALAGQSVVQRLVLAKEAADLCGSTFTMLVTERYFADEDRWRTNLATLNGIYRSRRDVMLEAIEEHFPHEASYSHPAGGFYVWVTSPIGSTRGRCSPPRSNVGSHTFPGPRSTPTAAGATRCGSPSAIHRPSASVRASRLGTLLGDEQATYRSLRP